LVTSHLAGALNNALGFIRSGYESRSSKAAYLHGSFGAGKSHFMAGLHLLLQHKPQARSTEGARRNRHAAYTDDGGGFWWGFGTGTQLGLMKVAASGWALTNAKTHACGSLSADLSCPEPIGRGNPHVSQKADSGAFQ